MERSVVLELVDVVAQVELLDLLGHLVAADRHHGAQQAEVNHRLDAANLVNSHKVENSALTFNP